MPFTCLSCTIVYILIVIWQFKIMQNKLSFIFFGRVFNAFQSSDSKSIEAHAPVTCFISILSEKKNQWITNLSHFGFCYKLICWFFRYFRFFFSFFFVAVKISLINWTKLEWAFKYPEPQIIMLIKWKC